LALALFRDGKLDRALDLYQLAQKNEPGDLVSKVGLAEVLLAKRKTDKALQILQQVYEADRDNSHARQLLFKMGY
jgi:predicted Zn-dependent protease